MERECRCEKRLCSLKKEDLKKRVCVCVCERERERVSESEKEHQEEIRAPAEFFWLSRQHEELTLRILQGGVADLPLVLADVSLVDRCGC